MGFDVETDLRRTGAESFEGELSPGWETPRGPLGGYVMALMMRGFELAVDDAGRQARSVTMHFLRVPEPGPVAVTARVERAGRSLTSVGGRFEQEGKLVGLALGAYSLPWECPALGGIPMPEVDPAEDVAPPDESGRRPGFTERLVMQHRFGPPPFSGTDRGEAGGWLGLREDRPLDARAVAVLADAWFPAPWPRLAELAPAPTIELTIHFRSPLPRPDDLLLGRFTNALVRDGFFDEDGMLWGRDGTLVAQSRQLGLLLGASAP
jgi:acyl-coenzyme A thioesterase PaaI-like protein